MGRGLEGCLRKRNSLKWGVGVWCVRNQEKGALAKGFFFVAEASVTLKKTKRIQGHGPSSSFGTPRATAGKGANHCRNPLLKSGEKKTNKHKQLRGIVPEMGGGQIVCVFPLFLGKKGNT